MSEKLRGNTRVAPVKINREQMNGSLVKAVEAKSGKSGSSDLPLVRAVQGRAPYMVINIGGRLSTVVVLDS